MIQKRYKSTMCIIEKIKSFTMNPHLELGQTLPLTEKQINTIA